MSIINVTNLKILVQNIKTGNSAKFCVNYQQFRQNVLPTDAELAVKDSIYFLSFIEYFRFL